MPIRRRKTKQVYDKDSIDSKITKLCTEIHHLKTQMSSSLQEDKKMHNIINKWLLALTIIAIIQLFGGPDAGRDIVASLLTKFAFAG